jgi:predicted tellurium resistance membrane protein TerC
MRGAMIAAGAYLIEQFHWVMYVFGAFLVFTGVRMATTAVHDIDPTSNPVISIVRRLIPVTPEYVGQQFFVRQEVGVTRMLLADIYSVPTALSLAVIVTVLGAATAASLLWPSAPLPHVKIDEGVEPNV